MFKTIFFNTFTKFDVILPALNWLEILRLITIIFIALVFYIAFFPAHITLLLIVGKTHC